MTRDGSADSMASKELFFTRTFCLEYSSALVYDGERVREPNMNPNMICASDSLAILAIILLLLTSPNSPLEMSLTPAQHAKVILQ